MPCRCVPGVPFDQSGRVRVETLQYNLIRSHALGLGRPYSPKLARGVLLARLWNLSRNRSAVRGELAVLCAGLLNAGVAPWIPRKGGVGASGDLVQLAHLGMLLIGEGRCWAQCEAAHAGKALAAAGLTPLKLGFRIVRIDSTSGALPYLMPSPWTGDRAR